MRLALVAVLLCVATVSAVRADIATAGTLFVNLDSTALPVGELASWANTGTLGGTFGSSTLNPVVGNVVGVNAVTFENNAWLKSDFVAPAEFTGSSDWSVELWALNPSIGGDEGMLTWSNRGEENMNAACCYSTAPVWGAFAGWAAGDIGYGNAIPPAAGIWHHIVFTYAGGAGGQLVIYVDGKLNNQAAKNLNIHGPGNTVDDPVQENPVIVGGSTGGDPLGLAAEATNQWFTGSLSKIRIHDGVLTPEQVLGNYDTEKAAYLSGVLVVTEPAIKALNFGMVALEDGQTAPKTVIVRNDGTADITFNTPAVSLTGANADQFVIVTPSFDTTPLTPGTTRTIQVAYDPSVKGNHVAQLAFSSSSPVATTVDLSGLGGTPDALVTAGDLLVNLNAKDLTAGVLQTWTNAGTIGGEFINPSGAYPTVENANGVRAVTFNSTWLKSDFLTTPDFTGNSNWSFETWMFEPSITFEEQVVTWANRGEENMNAAFIYGTAPNWGAFGGWGAGDIGFLNATPPAQGKWHLITITYAGGANSLLKVYADGVLNNSKTMSLAIHGPDDGQAMPIILGGSTGNNANGLDAVAEGWWFTGSLAAVRFHGGELTADQVFSNYMFEKNDYMFPALALDSPALPVLNFGPVALDAGASAPMTLTLRNSGESALIFANPAFTIAGADAAQFSLVTPPPASLAVGATCEVKVAFDPASAGSKLAQLTLLSNADPMVVDLIGFGGNTATVETAGDLLVNLDPSGLADGPLQFWTNAGTLGQNFTPWFDAPTVETKAGIKQVTFAKTTQGDYLTSDWFVPESIAGGDDYSFEVWALNPEIATEEVLVSWALRGGNPDGSAAQVNYGSSPDFGAVTHWGARDMGYLGGAPAAQKWHHIVVTYTGSTGGVPGVEKVYVDGVLNNQESKVLTIGMHPEVEGSPNLVYTAIPMNLGTALEADSSANAGLSYSGALGRVRVHSGQLTDAQVLNNYVADAPNYAAPTVKVIEPATGNVLFPAQAVEAGATAPKSVQIQNIGLTSLVFSGAGFAITGADADQFALVTPLDTTDVAAGTIRTVQVVFDPSSTGVKRAALTITTNATNASVDVALVGFGGTATDVAVATDLLVDLDSAELPLGVLNSWTNDGSLLGTFGGSTAPPTVSIVDGVRAVEFNQTWLKSSFLTTEGFTGASDWSLEAWVFDASVPDEQQVITWSNRGEENMNGAFLYGTNANWGAFGGWGAGDVGYANAVAPAAGVWHHVAITYPGGVDALLSVYVDGVLNNTKTMNLNIHGPADSQAMPVMLGGSTGDAALGLDATVTGWWYSGSMAQVRFHDGTLTADQVLQNYLVTQPSRLAPAPTGLDLAAADDTGVSATDNITKNTADLTISGTATADTTVKIKEGATVLATGTAVEFAAGLNIALAEGTHNITATSTDASSVESDVSDVLTIVVDATAPTLALSSTAPEPVVTVPFPVTATFNETVAGFEATDVVVANGTVVGFTDVDGKVYNFNVAVPAAATVTVDVAAGAATDVAGNESPAATQLVRTYNGSVTQYTLTANVAPANSGSVALDPAGGTYNENTLVTVTATPNAGYRFLNWTGDATGVETSVQVTMDGNKTVTANFELIPVYTLTLVADPANGGTVAKAPDLAGYEVGAQVTLTATPAEGFQFRGWVDGSTTVTSPYTMPAADKTLTAKFKPLLPNQYTVTVVADPAEGGTVSKTPDAGSYLTGAQVTLNAVAAEGYTFDGWYDGATQVSTDLSYVYTVADVNKVFTAKFSAVLTYTLTLVADPAIGGTVSKAPDQAGYEAGAQVTLTATPANGYEFRGWLDGSTTVTSPYTMPAENKTLTAKFKVQVGPPTYQVNVVADPVAGGTVSKAPDQASYSNGDQVTLSAVAAEGYTFRGWLDGATTASTQASFVYTVAANKTFTAKFKAVVVVPTYTLTLAADPANGGTVSKTPNQASYAAGAAVTLTATAMTGYEFVGWYDGATLLSSLTSYAYTMPAANKSLTAKFELSGLPAPANVTASGNTFRVLLNWDSVTSATAYLIERTAVDSTHTLSWTVSAADALVGTGTNAFADDTASPAIPYAYVVTALDAQENLGTPSLPATATVMAEVFAAANYKVTCKGYTLVRSASNDLTFEPTIAGSNPGTIKIALLKKMPSNAVDNAAKGIYYLTSVTQVPMLRVNGSVKTLAFDVPVLALVVRDLAKSVSAKSVTFLTANEFGSISIAATKDSGAGLYARTFIQTTSAGTTPMSIKVTGAVVEEVGSTATTAQPIKLLNVASKTYKDASKATRTSLGAIGSLPVVVNELQVGNTTSAPAEATPCSIQGSTLKAITVSGGPLVADELVGAIDKVTVAGGNLRCGLIQSSKDLVLVQATAKKGVGGAVGTAGSPLALVVKGQPSSKGVAIGKVSAQTGVSGFFYAGYDAATGAPTKSGGINILQTKSGVVEGAAFLDPALVSKLKILPKTPVQPIVINPGS